MSKTTETMLERAAKHAFAEGNPDWASFTDAARAAARRTAIDMLRAIRVPDERVLEAMRSAVATSGDCSGEQRGGGCRYGPKCTCCEGALIAWQAGIDAIEQGRKP